ncbi:MBL fold metallo-hydrolase [Cytophagaceae bacterium YF14B1]|uniref:MBL fold metallo-hydrolase n=1 Tax=Xanthocytophaga flava TaxID=3048013 RepID=A0AAE3QLF2_9BACT|nr:MBL fold metallo-hydrolase [Xanthocytophaga flavus]MDJ1481497.1 MBL fold metallo-hydrolase [Xanthocytophaga flavus]
MQVHVIDTGFFKLDGGAMYGVVPKSIWQKLNPSDENNLCSWAMRCLLIEDGNRLILIDTGLGNKQDAKFFSYYYLHGTASLLQSIQNAGFSPDEITDVILTHLHFDHVGGAVSSNTDKTKYFPTFKNARYWSTPRHWHWAIQPNPREKASFLKENILPLQESGQLHWIEEGKISPFANIDFLFVEGHTEAMLLPKIQIGNQTIVYMADLIPSAGHISLPYVMSYDVRPLLTMDEKATILNRAVEKEWILFFEHDPITECAVVQHTEKGIRIENQGALAEWLSLTNQ